MLQPKRKSFPYMAAGALVEEGEAHLCVLGEGGWPHYTTVSLHDPARWRKALATLADPATPTLGKHRRPALRYPIWLGLHLQAGVRLPLRLLALVLLPKGRLSVISDEVLDDYCRRLDITSPCRFDRSELLANYVFRNDPPVEDDLLMEAADRLRLPSVRSRARG